MTERSQRKWWLVGPCASVEDGDVNCSKVVVKAEMEEEEEEKVEHGDGWAFVHKFSFDHSRWDVLLPLVEPWRMS